MWRQDSDRGISCRRSVLFSGWQIIFDHVESKHDTYSHCLDVAEQRGGCFEALLLAHRSGLVNYTSLVDSAWGIISHYMDLFLDGYLPAIFTLVRFLMDSFRSAIPALSRRIVQRSVTMSRSFTPSCWSSGNFRFRYFGHNVFRSIGSCRGPNPRHSTSHSGSVRQ